MNEEPTAEESLVELNETLSRELGSIAEKIDDGACFLRGEEDTIGRSLETIATALLGEPIEHVPDPAPIAVTLERIANALERIADKVQP